MFISRLESILLLDAESSKLESCGTEHSDEALFMYSEAESM